MSSHTPRFPQFIIAGATRSGTTTLHDALSKSPHIFMPAQKELHFFFRDADFQKGADFYGSYFHDAQEGQICGEASPTYWTHGHLVGENGEHKWDPEDDSIVRIKKIFPDMKIILSLRHPALRAHSVYRRILWRGHEGARSFEAAIDEEMSGKRTPDKTPLCPLYLSRYKTHLSHVLKHFEQSNVLILIMEEWADKPSEAIRRIEDFVGVKSSGLGDADIQISNQGRALLYPWLQPLVQKLPQTRVVRAFNRRFLSKEEPEKLSEETFQRLSSYFDPDIAFLEGYLGRRLDAWRDLHVR